MTTSAERPDRVRRIVGVAVRTRDGQLFMAMKPARHGTVIRIACQQLGDDEGRQATHGFVDQTGRFYDRKEAAELAFANGQIDRKLPGLISENLW